MIKNIKKEVMHIKKEVMLNLFQHPTKQANQHNGNFAYGVPKQVRHDLMS
jgi:hypothetical protein